MLLFTQDPRWQFFFTRAEGRVCRHYPCLSQSPLLLLLGLPGSRGRETAPTEALGNWELNAGDLRSSPYLRSFLPVAAEFVESVSHVAHGFLPSSWKSLHNASFFCLLQLFGHTVWFILWEMGFGMGMKDFPGGASGKEPPCQGR